MAPVAQRADPRDQQVCARKAVQERVSQDQADRELILSLLHRPEVREIAAKAGLSLQKARSRCVDAARARICATLAAQARQVKNDLAGGASTVVISTTTIIIVLLLVILIVAHRGLTATILAPLLPSPWQLPRRRHRAGDDPPNAPFDSLHLARRAHHEPRPATLSPFFDVPYGCRAKSSAAAPLSRWSCGSGGQPGSTQRASPHWSTSARGASKARSDPQPARARLAGRVVQWGPSAR